MKNGISILKKNSAYDLEKYNSLFFGIGLVISLLLVVVLFEWKMTDRSSQLDLTNDTGSFEELLDIPISNIEPPPPPQSSSKSIEIIEVPDVEEIAEEMELILDIEMTQETKVEEINFEEIEEIQMEAIEEEQVDEIFIIVEEQPLPVGGYEEYYSFIYSEIKYPVFALRSRVEGRVFIQFVVEKDGSLTDFEVIRGIGAGCDEEAIRVLKMAPHWNPGKQRGKPVRVRMILPVIFKIVNPDS
jgi:protein TonB